LISELRPQNAILAQTAWVQFGNQAPPFRKGCSGIEFRCKKTKQAEAGYVPQQASACFTLLACGFEPQVSQYTKIDAVFTHTAHLERYNSIRITMKRHCLLS
jgi:hypothetical protein